MCSLNGDQSGYWRSISITSQWATHYDITMDNGIVRDAHCEIPVGNDVAMDINCDVTISDDVAMFTYRDIIMHNDIAMNLFYYVFSALCIIVLF